MRTYLSARNFKDAAILGAVVGIMAVPRIILSGENPTTLSLAVFPLMMLVAGAATAWGRSGRMHGLFPEHGRITRTVLVALGAGALIGAAHWAGDGLYRNTFAEYSTSEVYAMTYPPTWGGCFALILWSAGFETLFFRAATMSFLARVTGRQWVAIGGAVIFRTVLSFMTDPAGNADYLTLARMTGVALTTFCACLLYAQGGITPAMVFAAMIDARHLVRLGIEG
jgi:hypothetical protein